MKVLLVLAILSLKFYLCGLYDGKGDVKVLKDPEFTQQVKRRVSVVEFYADWCGHCKDFSRVYKDVAKVLKGVIPVIAVNDESLAKRYSVKGYPTVKVFVPNGDPEVVDYNEARSLEPLVTFAMKRLNKYVKDKVTKLAPKAKTETFGNVVQLTTSNFKQTVLDDSHTQWLVMFYAPWCGHCKQLEPEWAKMAKNSGQVKVGKVDCTVETSLASQYNIKGFPTIILFQGGKSVNYEGARKADDILSFAKRHYKNLGPPKKVGSVSDLKTHCSGPLCLLFFLNKDSESQLETIVNVRKKSPNTPFPFVYTTEGSNPQWEGVFRLGTFPTLVGLNLAKGVFVHMKTAFSEASVSAFINSITSGKAYAERLSEDLADEDVKTEL